MADYDNYETLSDHSLGIDRRYAFNSAEYPPGAVWDALNMVYERDNENPEKMRGYARLGSTDIAGTITGLADYDAGTRLIASASDGKWYERSTGDWAASTGATGYNTTATTRWAFEMFYGATTAANLLIGGNGIDAPQKYTSGAGASALGGSPPATGKFPTPWIGRLILASGDTILGSRVNDAEQWGYANGGFEIQVDRGSGDITGLTTFAGQLIIFKRNKILRIPPSTTLSVSDAVPVNLKIGTPSHHTIKEAISTKSASLMFMSDNGVEEMVPTSATGAFFVRTASDRIKPILDQRKKTSMATAWADFNPDRHEYYLTYGTLGTTPSEGVIGNVARGPRWTRHDMRNVTAGCIFRSSGEQIQVIGDTSGRVYQLHSGGARNTSAYAGTLTTAAYTQGAPFRMKCYGRYFADVETEGNYPVICRAILGRTGLTSPTSEEDILTFGGGDGWGVGAWGVASWGGSGSAGKYIRLDKVRRGSFIRISVETTGTSQWFKLRQMMIESDFAAGVLAA